VVERNPQIVVLSERAILFLRLEDIVFCRATAAVAIGHQEDELALVRRLKVRAINEHDRWEDEEEKHCCYDSIAR
jgi:hypothetical protein